LLGQADDGWFVGIFFKTQLDVFEDGELRPGFPLEFRGSEVQFFSFLLRGFSSGGAKFEIRKYDDQSEGAKESSIHHEAQRCDYQRVTHRDFSTVAECKRQQNALSNETPPQ
jgi:hypothetical protein